MLVGVLVGVGALVVAVLGVVLVRRLLRGRVLRVLASVLVVVAVALVGTRAWAQVMLDDAAAARAIAWREADTGDVHRFASHPVAAGDDRLVLRDAPLPPGALDGVRARDGRTLDALLADTGTAAFVVLRGSDVLVEEYGPGSAATTLQTSFSVAKSVLATVLGIAVDRGDVGSLDDPVTAYVPELADRDPRFADVTLRHLVTMSSGLAYEEQGLPWSDDSVTYYSPDLRATALSARVAQEPGRTFLYNNYNPLLVGLVLERATGRPLAEYTSEVLWQPLGAGADASWSVDSVRHGFAKMESGFNATALDYARLGYLMAHEGAVDGRQVVSSTWVAQATAADTTTDPAARYQYFWWVDTERDGRFYGHGNHGQFVYVDPVTDVVVVRLGARYGVEPDAWVGVLREVADAVAAS
ncbi:serine hydrolase [Cellulomonas sp. JZ18]|uniref:serine hydrolase domain-containing protein n=1 Tax=Cellulomonas sp. JZ18 TaxID=2654191 RepID=UPI001E53C340|nr:serine hydrolase [Cellulomonas sp. JZ18]